jgi:hypothetical protein
LLKSRSQKKQEAIQAKQLTSFKSVKGEFTYETDDEIDRLLAGDKYLVEFYKMSVNDPVCGAVLLALTQIFKSIKWDTEDDEDNLLKDSLEKAGWIDNMGDMLTQFVFGHSVMEVTLTERDKDGRVIWNNMYYRPQTTITDWKFDKHGKLLAVIQDAGKGNPEVRIKADKCLIFHAFKTQVNPRGKSLFRNAYRDWYYKTNIEKIEAIGIERDLTGLPVLCAAPDVELQDEKGVLNAVGNWAWTTVRNIKRNSQEGLVLPDGWEFKLIGSPGQRQFDLNDVINRYSTNMALSMLAQFLVLGVTSSSGSFALAKEQSSLFHTAVEGFAYAMVDVVNNQFIGGKALQLFNDLEKQPKLKATGIERIDISDMASYLGRLLKFNIIEPDDALEDFVRERVALPKKDPTTTRVADVKLAHEQKYPETVKKPVEPVPPADTTAPVGEPNPPVKKKKTTKKKEAK